MDPLYKVTTKLQMHLFWMWRWIHSRQFFIRSTVIWLLNFCNKKNFGNHKTVLINITKNLVQYSEYSWFSVRCNDLDAILVIFIMVGTTENAERDSPGIFPLERITWWMKQYRLLGRESDVFWREVYEDAAYNAPTSH